MMMYWKPQQKKEALMNKAPYDENEYKKELGRK